MRTLTKTGIRILSAQYRSILKKCVLLNAVVLMFGTSSVLAADMTWSGLKSEISGLADKINITNNIKRDVAGESGDITILHDLNINGQNHILSGNETGQGLTIGEYVSVQLQRIAMQHFLNIGGNGGAINNYGGSVRIVGADDGTTEQNITAFDHNSASINGGAIYNTSTITGINGDFISNSANDSGGAIYNTQTIGNITGNFINNSASIKGGAVYNADRVKFIATTRDITFDGNYVTSGNGGAIYNVGTVGLYAGDGYSITFLGDNATQNIPDDAKDVDGIYNQDILNINGDGNGKIYLGTVNLYNVSDNSTAATGTTNIYGGKVFANANFMQSILNNQAEFNFNGTTGLVDTLSGADGTTNIYTGSFTVKGTAIQDTMTVAKNAVLNLDGYSEINNILHDGNLILCGAEINQITGTGTTTIYEYVSVNTGITQDNLIIDDNFNAYLTVSADGLNIKNGITNNGVLELMDGILTSDINGSGTIRVDSYRIINKADIFNNIGNAGKIENNGNIVSSKFVNWGDLINNQKLETGSIGNSGSIINNGTIIADVIENQLAEWTMNSGSIIQGDIYGGNINSNGTNTVVGSIQDAELNLTNLYLNDGILNMSGEINVSSTTANGGSLGLIDNNISTANLGNLSLDNNMDVLVDADLAKKEMDTIKLTGISGDGTINISDIRILSDSTPDSLLLFTETIPANVIGHLKDLPGPIFMYNADYDDGRISFTRTGARPYLYAPSVVANTTATMTTQIAALAMDKMDDVVHTQGRSGGDTPTSSNVWVKVMGLNDNVEFNNFENIDSKAMTVTAGYNTNKITCGDCGIVFGAYAGYIGGKQQYTANDIDQDGGYVGLSSALTLGDAFLTATVNGGLLKNKANNMYGSDRFNTRWLGAGLKTGYNFAITDSVVLQPNMYGGYTLVNTQDYTSVSGVKIATNNLNFFEIDPGLKLSAVIADGWTGSVQGKYAIVTNNGDDITVNDIALQNISSKNYFEYGIGIDKSVTDAFYLGAKINRHDGGRTGWNGSIEFRYNF